MSKAKMITSTLIAVVAFSALVSASASAATAGWMVGGTLLNGTRALATTAAVDEAGVLKSSAADVEIKCKANTLNGIAPEIQSPNTGQATSLEFTECEALTANCTIGSSTIGTVPISVEATLEGALAVVATFKPKTKATFATFEFTGSNCATAGINGVTGTVKVLAPTGQDERTLQLINSIATEASGELKILSSPASLLGSILLKLASGEPWSFL
jgi:hypothetical protein